MFASITLLFIDIFGHIFTKRSQYALKPRVPRTRGGGGGFLLLRGITFASVSGACVCVCACVCELNYVRLA